MGSFTEFYSKLMGNYQCVGVAPMGYALKLKSPGQLLHKIQAWLPVLVVLVLFWGTLVYSLVNHDSTSDLISVMSNIIQMLLNGVAFSVVIVSAVYKREAFLGILEEFDRIDHQFTSFGIFINYKKQRRVFYVALLIFGLVTSGVNVYEIYVTESLQGITRFLYWVSHALPSIIYGICMEQAIFLIYCVLIRCEMVIDLLQRRRSSQRHFVVSKDHATNSPSMAMVVRGNDETIKNVYQLIDGIHELCEKVNKFFGLSFLATLLAMFAVTSIQAFYCYKIASDINPELGRSYWVLCMAVNLVVVNTGIVCILAYMADRVTNEATCINNRVRKLENDQVIQYSSWLHPVLINIKISAFGFFNLNCTMLCAYMSALITYMLILIQCNEIGGEKDKSVSVFTKGKVLTTPSSVEQKFIELDLSG